MSSSQTTPPPLPPDAAKPRRKKFDGQAWLLIVCVSVPIILRMAGLIRAFSIPTGGMSPAVSPGDHIFGQGLAYLAGTPKRGEVVIFETKGIVGLRDSGFFIQRVVGLPGDHLQLRQGKLYINGTNVVLNNNAGPIHYVPPSDGTGRLLQLDEDIVEVPKDSYFLLGDNSPNSFDSRYWGFVPAQNIRQRASFCYWPPGRFGFIQ